MAKKFLLPALVTCVAIAAGATLMSIRNDMLSHTAPPRERHQSTVTRELPLGRQRRAEPRPKNSEQSNPTPKADTALVEPSPQPRIHSGLYVEVQHSDVTLRAENQSLKKVLEALAHKSGIQINAQLIVDRPLSIQLVRVPLDRALQTILEFEDSFLAFESRGQANVALKAVWVVPAGTGGKWPPQTSACARELSEIEQQLASAHSSQRAEAIETLIDLQGPDAAQAVVQSLRDQDDDVRYRALQKAYVAGLALPPEVLAGLVQHDNSELVRMMAVEAIGAHPSINEQDKMAFARYAISDGSPAVQTRASELLSHLESAPLMREYEELLYDEATQETFAEFPEENIGERGE